MHFMAVLYERVCSFDLGLWPMAGLEELEADRLLLEREDSCLSLPEGLPPLPPPPPPLLSGEAVLETGALEDEGFPSTASRCVLAT